MVTAAEEILANVQVQGMRVVEQPQGVRRDTFSRGCTIVNQFGASRKAEANYLAVTNVATLTLFAGTGAELTVAHVLKSQFYGTFKPGQVAMYRPVDARMHPMNMNNQPPQDTAINIRREWMQKMGLSEEEIAEYSDESKYPANMQDELDDLAAAARIAAREQQ